MSMSDSDSSSSYGGGDYRNFKQISRDRLLHEMLRSTKTADAKSTWKVLMSKFYSITQWNGLPRESVASLISDHILHLPKHRAECCIIETTKVLVTWTTKMTFDTVISGFERLEPAAILLKQARDLLSSGNNPQKALELALSAMKMFEKFGYGKQSLELLRCLHLTTEKYCSLGQYYEASPLLEHSIEIPANQILLDALTLQGMGFITLNNTFWENWEE